MAPVVTVGTPPNPVAPTVVAGRPTKLFRGATPTATAPALPAAGTSVARARGTIAGPSPSAIPGAGRATYRATLADPLAPTVVPGRPRKVLRGTFAVVLPQAIGGLAGQVIPDGVFIAAEAKHERFPYGRFFVDWTAQDYTGPGADLSRVATSIEVERSRTGDLPESAGLVDGYDSATAKVSLQGTRDGATMTVAGELSPYRSDRPRYGSDDVTAPAIIDMGLITDDGPRHYRQFTGPVRTIGVNESTERAALALVDPNESLRELITLPTYGEYSMYVRRRPWTFTVNSMGVIDHVLRRNGINCSPKARADALISATGHGWLVPEVGFSAPPILSPINDVVSTPKGEFWTSDSHPFGMLGTPEATAGPVSMGYQRYYGITDGQNVPVRFSSGYGVGVSAWVHIGSYYTVSLSQAYYLFQVRPTINEYPKLSLIGQQGGSVFQRLEIDANTKLDSAGIQTGSSRWRHIGMHFRWTSDTTVVMTLRVDGVTYTTNGTHSAIVVNATDFVAGYKANIELRAFFWRGWSNLQLWKNYAVPTTAEWQALENWTPQASVARGLNEMTYLPQVEAVDSWELLKTVVAAEYGVHGFDPAGRYFFRPRADTYTGTPDVDIDVLTNLAEVSYSVSSDSVRNVVGYSVTPMWHAMDNPATQGAGLGASAVYSADDPMMFVVPAQKRYVYEIDIAWGIALDRAGVLTWCYQDGADPTVGYGYSTTGTPKWGESKNALGWTYSYQDANGNWTGKNNVQSVVVRFCQIGLRRVQIIVDNTHSSCTRAVRIATADDANGNAGAAALKLAGWPLKGDAPHVAQFRNQASIDRHRGQARAYPIPDSPWRSNPGVLDPVCSQLATAMGDAIPVLEDLPVRGNPRTQVGMIARLRFRDRTNPIVGTIVKTNRVLDATGIHDKVSVRPLPAAS